VTDARRTYTYAQLKDEVAAFAGALVQLGVGHGDRVVIYMPMVPEANSPSASTTPPPK
jgi:propionyl-CoA synthetase